MIQPGNPNQTRLESPKSPNTVSVVYGFAGFTTLMFGLALLGFLDSGHGVMWVLVLITWHAVGLGPEFAVSDRLFRRWIRAGLVSFMVLSLLKADFLDDSQLFENSSRLVGYGCFWAGIGVYYQKQTAGGFAWRSWYVWLGVTVFIAGLVAYGFLLPSQYAPLAVHYGSLCLFPMISGCLVVACVLATVWKQTERRVAGALGAAAAFWFCEDLFYFLGFHYEGILNLLAPIFGVGACICLARMGVHAPRPGADRREGERKEAFYLGRVWMLALLFPLLHVLGNRLGLLSPETLAEREWMTLIVSLALAGVGLMQTLHLKRRSLTLQSSRDMAELHQTRHDLKSRVEEEHHLLNKAEDDLQKQIEKRLEVEKGLKQSQERFRVLVETMNEGMFVLNEKWEITYVNMALCRMLGYAASEMTGQNFRNFFNEQNLALLDGELEKWEMGRDDAYEISWTHKEEYGVSTMVSPRGIRDGAGRLKGSFAVVADITEQKRVQEEMRVMSQYDALTTLPNRTLLNERLEQAITRARRYNQQLALLYMDLDRFKRINDSLGHRIGDLLLLSVAMRLKNGVRELDTVARLSGDEFIIILSDVEDSMAVVVVIEKIQEAFQAPFNIEGYEVSITPSIGVSMFPNDGHDPASLIKNADAATYHVKTQGRNNYQFYTREMNQAALHRLNLENRLRLALEQNELQLYYQPKLDLKTRAITGVEALARWRHPELGLIVPDKFIPVAEDTGLILPLGEWVMEEACRQAREWQEQGLPPIKVAINLSPMQFGSETLPAQVVSALAKSNLQPEFLELEITESLVMEDAERTIRLLAHLKAMGISITVDDFGTGYSSLNYLKQFPIDGLKIDRGFVREMESNSSDEAIVRAVIAMSHGMNMSVIAEGVEKKTHLDHLTAWGCDYAQGFYISQPVDMDGLKAMVLKRASEAGEQTEEQ